MPSKQEEIREAINTYADNFCLYLNRDCEFHSQVRVEPEYCVDAEGGYKCLTKRLGELGVVVRVERELPKIIDWLVFRRRKLNEEKKRHALIKPNDKRGLMVYGVKARVIQEVINYLNSQLSKEEAVEPLA